jgi:hypothetical protein
MNDPERYIFLDVDGVLNHRAYLIEAAEIYNKGESNETWHLKQLDGQAVARLDALLRRTGAKVVISSSWRGLVQLPGWLRERGLSEAHEIVGVTPRIPGPRGLEIQEWMTRHRVAPEQIVILDDEDDMAHLAHRLVQTSFMDDDGGLRERHVERAVALFETKQEETP